MNCCGQQMALVVSVLSVTMQMNTYRDLCAYSLSFTAGYINQFLINWKRYPTEYPEKYVREIPIGHTCK